MLMLASVLSAMYVVSALANPTCLNLVLVLVIVRLLYGHNVYINSITHCVVMPFYIPTYDMKYPNAP